MATLLSDVTTVLQSDTALASKVGVIETGSPSVEYITDKLRGASVHVINGGVKRVSDVWREAVVHVQVTTRRPNMADSDALNTEIGDLVNDTIYNNHRLGQFSTGVSGRLVGIECDALDVADNPEIRVRLFTVTYKVFRS